ncbi:hypothetical protein AM493_20340 [Flavobacterium akiainvivens]|uniref:Uncharacterized protein n=2 Tax=Flavobacterium akiainvivens TaxID=1202724 RepID=A0A0M8MG23_9FLAO|nr:hypothetical protein AM493_20340 [Flavobacterium akiainvivens]SFQ72195.1 hypothetical protein SAMN05444144_11776 [Flavobacterium akiainvivens]
MAAALATAIMSCKNDAKPSDAKTDSTGAKTETTADGGTEAAAPVAGDAITETADGKILMRLNYPKGFKQQLTYNMDMILGSVMKNKVTMYLDMEVVSVTGGAKPVYGLKGAITGMTMDSDAMGQKIKYDSSKKAANMTPQEQAMDKQLREVIGQPITVSVDNTGKVVGKMEFKSKDGLTQNEPFDMKNLQMSFPEKPVGVGDTWTEDVEMKNLGGTVKNTYTVKQITDNDVTIALVTVVPKTPSTGKDTKLAGSYTLDRKTGMVLKGGIKGDMTQQGMDATIDMSFTGKRVK